MRNKIKLTNLVILLFLCIGCNSDDEVVPPSVVTGSSQVLSEGGVILSGNFQNFNNQAVLGFEVYNFSIGSFLNILLTDPTDGVNTTTITAGLYVNQEYKFRAYIITESETYYGLEESFLSTGSADASFLSISPSQGDFKDAVEIVTDVELSEAYINGIVVLFSSEEATNISIDGNSIICEVPYYDGDPVSEIQVNYFGNVINTALNYQLLPPVIESISPNNVTYREEVVISGNHFEDVNPQYLKVYVDDIEAVIVQKSKTSLTIRIPDNVVSASPSIKIESNLQEVELQNAITMKAPVITSYTTSGNIFDTIDIFVDNISPIYFNNEVYFDGVLGDTYQPSDGSTNRIAVQVPQGPYVDWNPTITVKTSDEIISSESPFTILDSAIEVTDHANVPIQGYQIFNDNIYVYGFDLFNSFELIINKYSESDNEFYDEQLINMPVSGDSSVRFINSSDGYIYMLYSRQSNNFFKVNLSSFNIEPLADLPDGETGNAVLAFHNNEIIVGLGGENPPQGSYYSYSINNNVWQSISNTISSPFHKRFYAENESYYIEGPYSVATDLYRYNGNEYVLIANTFPIQFRDYTAPRYIFKDEKFYFIKDFGNSVVSNPVMVFDTTNYSWTELFNFFPNDDYSITGIFERGNYIYVQIIAYNSSYHLLKVDLTRL
ncbi:IPT/TIG domain-containing protein [Winogradskyella sp. R77965]|uniref:IPT/TIG domain-containing protein n=1 Tax=Winogradskyella sp. R77965 TaxID=3093872 RepID=UPI0037DD37AC